MAIGEETGTVLKSKVSHLTNLGTRGPSFYADQGPTMCLVLPGGSGCHAHAQEGTLPISNFMNFMPGNPARLPQVFSAEPLTLWRGRGAQGLFDKHSNESSPQQREKGPIFQGLVRESRVETLFLRKENTMQTHTRKCIKWA